MPKMAFLRWPKKMLGGKKKKLLVIPEEPKHQFCGQQR